MAFTCSFDGNVHIYDTSALEAPAPVGSKSPLSLSPIAHYSHAAINAANTSAINNVLYDGRFMYSAANDGEIHITDVEMMSNQYGNLPSPRLQRILRGHEHWIWCLEKPTTDQSLLVSGSVDRCAVF